MVRGLIIFISIIVTQSCCYNGLKNEYGFPRKASNFTNSFNIDVNSKIDTSCVYERIGYFDETNNFFGSTNISNIQFLKFYSNNKVGQFSSKANDKIKKDYDPKKAIMGYYYYKKKSYFIKQFGLNQCKSWIFVYEVLQKKDTLILLDNISGHNNAYIKKKLGKEFLIYKPDW